MKWIFNSPLYYFQLLGLQVDYSYKGVTDIIIERASVAKLIITSHDDYHKA